MLVQPLARPCENGSMQSETVNRRVHGGAGIARAYSIHLAQMMLRLFTHHDRPGFGHRAHDLHAIVGS